MSTSVGSEDSFQMMESSNTVQAPPPGGGQQQQQQGSPGLNKTSSIHTLVPAQPEVRGFLEVGCTAVKLHYNHNAVVEQFFTCERHKNCSLTALLASNNQM